MTNLLLQDRPAGVDESLARLGVQPGRVHTYPFAEGDVTAGSETELQTAVVGTADRVDLPLTIRQSNYFANVVRRAAAGDTSRRVVTRLEAHLESGPGEFWENSWVRIPMVRLGPAACRVLCADLKADKTRPDGPDRSDAGRFVCQDKDGRRLRVPISYLIKLALADAVDGAHGVPEPVTRIGVKLLDHFLDDNSSPESFSFHLVGVRAGSGGRSLARETARRSLLTQLLVLYANRSFGLLESGQRATIFFSPHPALRQKELNDCISDAFYRELFVSPCLSGWDRGEAKYEYMLLCHQVISRSHLNGLAKLREAGIITRNLVVLPHTSNLSLANNGVHVSIGSTKLSRALASPANGFGPGDEKYLGDLVLKIVEHFLPLFVGTYSGAPYRLDFTDFHPERVLGFLAHELDFTHLRMLWRRWKKKAKNRVLSRSLTPFGPEPLDRALKYLFNLKGDLVQDIRLLDYPVALMGTETSSAMDGSPGNGRRLKKDLTDLGVFDTRMSLYLPVKLREFQRMGFSGYEARHYSLFPSLEQDLAQALNLQVLVTALAWKYVVEGTFSHRCIPDSPFVESERRQIFFGSALGIPTFYVRQDTPNRFLANLVKRVRKTRKSRRYPGCFRIYNQEYRKTLMEILWSDARELVEMYGMEETLADLRMRIEDPLHCSAWGRIVSDVAGRRRNDPMGIPAAEFNRRAERYYSRELRKNQMREALRLLAEDLRSGAWDECPDAREAAGRIPELSDGGKFLNRIDPDHLDETATAGELRALIHQVLLAIGRNMETEVG